VELTGVIKKGLVAVQIVTALFVKVARVSGTDMYGKEWACDTAEWYSDVGGGREYVWN
jgi:hypothetical protein